MVEGRPDWLISRQRAWGTPLAMFVDKHTGQPLHDDEVDARILEADRRGRCRRLVRPPRRRLPGPRTTRQRYEKIDDILDVWFDSGCTHAFTLEARDPAHGYTGDRPSHWPADLYLEGSDQHRGWFQSNLLEGSGTRGRAPYDAVLTHGFTQDENGEKMSKSKGNTTDPAVIIKESGADILRLWVALVDYAEDQRIGKTDPADHGRRLSQAAQHRPLPAGRAGRLRRGRAPDRLDQMPPLEQFILHRLYELDGQVRAGLRRLPLPGRGPAGAGVLLRTTCRPCIFDIRKDSLYCDRPDALRRRAARTVMDEVFERLTAWLAPLIAVHHGRGLEHPVPGRRLQLRCG